MLDNKLTLKGSALGIVIVMIRLTDRDFIVVSRVLNTGATVFVVSAIEHLLISIINMY